MGWAKEGIFPFSHKEPVTGGGAFEPKANYSILNCKCAILQLKMALCWQTLTDHFSTKIYMMTVKKDGHSECQLKGISSEDFCLSSFLTCAHTQSFISWKTWASLWRSIMGKTEGDFFSLICPLLRDPGFRLLRKHGCCHSTGWVLLCDFARDEFLFPLVLLNVF